eukprot:1160954-Pelagomonas_calceolata.AAC.5
MEVSEGQEKLRALFEDQQRFKAQAARAEVSSESMAAQVQEMRLRCIRIAAQMNFKGRQMCRVLLMKGPGEASEAPQWGVPPKRSCERGGILWQCSNIVPFSQEVWLESEHECSVMLNAAAGFVPVIQKARRCGWKVSMYAVTCCNAAARCVPVNQEVWLDSEHVRSVMLNAAAGFVPVNQKA